MAFLEEKKKKGRIYWYATERKMVTGVRETVEGSARAPRHIRRTELRKDRKQALGESK